MKKILFILFSTLIGYCCFGQQVPKVSRGTSTVQPVDQNLLVAKNFGIPIYADTTAANLALKNDTVGYMIYTTGDSTYWGRKPKVAGSGNKWVELGSGSADIEENIGIKINGSSTKDVSSKSPSFKNIGEMRSVPANLLDTGTIYFRNTRGVFIPYKWSDTCTMTDDSVSVVQRTGTATGRFMLYYEDFVMVEWFGAFGDDLVDDSYAVQKTVNFALNQTKAPRVQFGGGNFYLNNVKLAKKNGIQYSFSTVEVRGTAFLPGTRVIVNNANGVGFFVQNARQTVIDNIYFSGQLTGPASDLAIFTQSDSAWCVGVRNNRFSPHAAIVDGAFHNSVEADSMYPGESAWYSNTTSSGSSGLVIKNCFFANFNVAIAQGLSGVNANGDNVLISDCSFETNRIVYAPCQTQSRDNSIVNCYMIFQQYVVNAVEFANRQGTPPSLVQLNIAGGTKYVYEIGSGFGGMAITRCRMESVFSLGLSSGYEVNFQDCGITFAIPGLQGQFADVKMAEGSFVTFKGGEMKFFDDLNAAGIVFNVENLSFDGVNIGGIPINLSGGALYNTFLNKTTYNNCRFSGFSTQGDIWQANTWKGVVQGATYMDRNAIMPNMKIIEDNSIGYDMYNSYESLSPKIDLIHTEETQLQIDSATATAYFIADNPGRYGVYDMLIDPFDKRLSPNSMYSETPSTLGWVYEISGDTVKLKYVTYGLDEATTYYIMIARIPRFAPKLIGDLSGGSNEITNAKYIYPYPVGALIKGSGILPGTRVVSVVGTTVTISTNATAPVTGNEFYDAKMFCSAIGNPTDATSSFGYYKGDIMRDTDNSTSVTYWECTQGGWLGGSPPQTALWRAVSFDKIPTNGVAYGATTDSIRLGGSLTRALTIIDGGDDEVNVLALGHSTAKLGSLLSHALDSTKLTSEIKIGITSQTVKFDTYGSITDPGAFVVEFNNFGARKSFMRPNGFWKYNFTDMTAIATVDDSTLVNQHRVKQLISDSLDGVGAAYFRNGRNDYDTLLTNPGVDTFLIKSLNMETPGSGITWTKTITDSTVSYLLVGLAAGKYTPTLSGVANVNASTPYECQYLRVGNVITVSGKVDIDATVITTLTQLGVSLPIASDIANEREAGGTAVAGAVASLSAAIKGDATNNRVTIEFVSLDINNNTFFFTFTYYLTPP